MIVSGSASQSLAAALATELDEPLAAVSYDRFPDGERFVSLSSFDADRAIVVASTVSNDTLVELLLLQDAVREAGVSELVTVIPYLGYARQDRAFEPGEPVSARAVARAVSTGTDQVLTVTPHERSVCAYFDPPATAIDGAARLATALPDDLADPVFLAPDAGASGLAKTVRDGYGTGETDHFEKTRTSGRDVEVAPSDVEVTDRDVVVVDDIVATGRTMSEALSVCADRGASRTFVTCVHPLLVGNAATSLSRAGVDAVYGTDTIERPVSTISVAPAVVGALEEL